jgi:hypothetical protein
MDGTKVPRRGGKAAVPDTAPPGAQHDDEPDEFEDFDAWLSTTRRRPTVRAFGRSITAPPIISVRAAARWQQIQTRGRDEPVTPDELGEFLDLLYSQPGLGASLLDGGADHDALLALVIWGFRNGRGVPVTLAEAYEIITTPSQAVGPGKAPTPGDESDATGESS